MINVKLLETSAAETAQTIKKIFEINAQELFSQRYGNSRVESQGTSPDAPVIVSLNHKRGTIKRTE